MDFLRETGEVVQLPDDPSALVIDVDFHRVIFLRADLRGRRFERCSFRNTLFGLSRLDSTTFEACVFAMAEFDGASLKHAVFSGGLLNGASFHAANLVSAVFNDVDLTGARFTGANLDGAQFMTDPGGALFDGALYTSSTSWPPGFDPSLHGMRAMAEPAS